ncbi:hypothetical protein B4102_3295 [Heyndrickxia sporothermodurans]|uniref:Uncharacterized protein n=1 Tax=Heyndrickxia sporothermodurans TaxID=46224 RepID=A0A150KW59_9BACI|nr:ABC transporter ATP-binding protein [Heyndrickxia sporothermodurans]KYD04315.1 hypothetical protein B4102_3295 [Heyndrickxia sporothermodurans]
MDTIKRPKALMMYFLNILSLYKKIGSIDKFYIVNSILTVLIKAVHPFNSILFLKIIVDELTGNSNWKVTVGYVLLMCILELFFRSLSAVLWTYELRKIVHFKSIFIKELNLKTMSLSYQQIEDPKLIDDRHKAMEIFYPGQAQFMDLKNTLIDSKQLIAYIIQFCGVIAILFTLSPYIFFILLATYFISNLLNTIAADKEFNVWSLSLVNIGRRIGYFQELATDYKYAKEMRINKLGQWLVDKIYYYFNNMKKDVHKAVRTFTVISMIANTLQILVNGGVYFFIGWLAYKSIISLSEVIVYINSLGVFVLALLGISSCWISLQKAGMHLSTYFRYLETVSKNVIPSGNGQNQKLDTKEIKIEFIDVWFKYPGHKQYTIKNLDLTIYPNEKLAIVGENGAGKTTLIKLLLRFYKPTKGYILINGMDINRIKIEEYMNIITAVFQDFNTLNFSLKENLVFDNNYESSEIEEILQTLNLNNTISKLPKGIDTELGRLFDQEGIELSGGQQQKLAIARALVKNSPIVILDEPTAMLSPTAEYEIYTNFAGLTQDKSTIYISHRMSSCRFCDRIIVMKLGEIVELGSHDQLMQEKGNYYTLFMKQAEFYNNIDEQNSISI